MPTMDPADLRAVEDGLEDRQLDLVVRRQADEHERPAAAQRPVGGFECLGRDGRDDRGVGPAEPLLHREVPKATEDRDHV